jgi:hypothetical protein
MFWPVLETRLRKRSTSPPSLNQLEDILQKEWYTIPLQTLQNLYEFIPRRSAALLKQKMAQRNISKQICTVSVVLQLFGPTPDIYIYIYI